MQKRRIITWMGVLALACLTLVAIALWSSGVLRANRETGYFSPVFAADGASVFGIRREVTATVAGLGYEMWTPPAAVWLHRDRFALVNIRVSDATATVVEAFPPSPLEGERIQAYHGAIFGVAAAHLRWAGDHLEYEISVTRHDTPLARTFVLRRVWDREASAFIAAGRWVEASAGMGGDDPQQLFGDLEVIAAPGDELLPCALVLVRKTDGQSRALVENAACRRKYPSGFAGGTLASSSRRADLERSATMTRTYNDAVARGRASGLSEGEAMLKANKEMERLGFYPKSTTITAHAASCAGASPIFRIADEEFRVGLFSDIGEAIDHPGEEIDKSQGDYVIHQNFHNSLALNALLSHPDDATFYVDGRGGCWRLDVDRQ